MYRLLSLAGILVLIGIAFLLSNNKRRIRWKTILWGFALQFVLAVLVLKTTVGREAFSLANDVIIGFLDYTRAGAGFVFGNLIDSHIPVGPKPPNADFSQYKDYVAQSGAFFAFTVIPTILFFSSFMMILYHLGIVQKVVHGVAWVMARTMKTSGAESLSASADIFVGQTEAPLVVRPYIGRMTQSELMAVMTAGFATVAGGVMAAYVAMLKDVIPSIAGHLMAASIMSAPAALALAKIVVPETETPETQGTHKVGLQTGHTERGRRRREWCIARTNPGF